MSTIGHLFYTNTLEIYLDTAEPRTTASGYDFDIYVVGDCSSNYLVEETDAQYIIVSTPGSQLAEVFNGRTLTIAKSDIDQFEYDADGLLIRIIGGAPSVLRLQEFTTI